MRINITISDQVNAKLDAMSDKWGVPKSNICAVVLGQYVDGLEKSYDFVKNPDDASLRYTVKDVK